MSEKQLSKDQKDDSLIHVVFSSPEEFFDELKQDRDRIDRRIVRITRVYEPASIGAMQRLTVEASAVVSDRYVYRLKVIAGMVWNVGGKEDEAVEKKADETIRRIETFCSNQGLIVRTGHIAS